MPKAKNIQQILERQARSWDERRSLAAAGGGAAREALVHLREGPWITVSRQWGAGGLDLARELGRVLGWQVYDREILVEIARHDHVREEILARFERRTRDTIADYIAHLVAGDPSLPAYLQEMMQVVSGLARQGRAVIVGRGANWFLDPSFGLRLRVVAPLERRVARVAEAERLTADAARQRIVEREEQRRGFVSKVFEREIDDPLGYDLVLNTDRLDAPSAVAVVESALRAKLQAVEPATSRG